MSSINKSLLCYIISLVLFAVSCSKDKDEESLNTYSINNFGQETTFTYLSHSIQTTASKSDNENREIVLGEARSIPYSMANMRTALEFINANSSHLNTIILPTHYYVKFSPTNDSHLAILDSLCSEVSLYNYPIDYDVATEGSFLITAQETQNKFAPLYGTLPISFNLPSIPYTILDTIYDPGDDELDLIIASYVLTGNSDMLGIQMNGEDLNMTTLVTYLNMPEETKASNTYYPEGILEVFDNSGYSYVPVPNTQLNIVRFGISHPVKTDNNGHFKLEKKMRGEVKVKANWRNGDYIIRKHWNEMIGIGTSDLITTINKNTSGPNNVIEIPDNDKHLWFKATVSNALWKYNTHMENCGIPGVKNNANIWIVVSGAGGATPMAKRYEWYVPYNALFANWLKWLMPISYPVITILNLLSENLYPDIVFSPRIDASTRGIEKLVFHEAGHFSHGVKVGGNYWGTFVRAELENILSSSDKDPYLDGTQPTNSLGKRIALCEGWADFCCYLNFNHYYDNCYFNNIEKYTMRTIPGTIRSDFNSWFLTGLFWDIVDNHPESNSRLINGIDESFINNIIDNVSIGDLNNIQPLHLCLISSVTDANSLKNALKTAYPNKSSLIDQLFNRYGF